VADGVRILVHIKAYMGRGARARCTSSGLSQLSAWR